MQDTEERMRAILAEIEADYDFSQFTMKGFIHWLEQYRGRRIIFVPCHIPSPTISGAWLAGEDQDFVFFEKDTPAVHQTHIQLHEMAHMLCGHPTLKVSSGNFQVAFRRSVGADQDGIVNALLLHSHSSRAESEAETLASLIQEKVLHFNRLRELTELHSLDRDFVDQMARYLDTLG